jgi:quercetin dioxygenase-like cupin family protein
MPATHVKSTASDRMVGPAGRLLRGYTMRYALLLVAALLPSGALAAQKPQSQSPEPRQAHVLTPEHLNWGPAPGILPAGARLAVLDGDPSKAGPYTMRLEMPAGYRIPPHFHKVDEHVTVISGAFQVGMGDTFDEDKLTTLPPGTFGVIPPGMRHFARADKATVVQLHGMGPWGLTYVNPADQPSTASH